MWRALLLYNPASGIRKERRLADVEAVVKVLREAGVEISSNTSGGPESTLQQVRQAIADGLDAVLACGGYGTLNNGPQRPGWSPFALGFHPVSTAPPLPHS